MTFRSRFRPSTNSLSGNVAISGSLTLNGSPISTGSSGEITTASNIGSGEGLFSSKNGVDLNFRSLVGSGSISILSGSNTIAISASSVDTSNFISGPTVGVNNIDNNIMLFSGSTYRDAKTSIVSISPSGTIILSGTTIGGFGSYAHPSAPTTSGTLNLYSSRIASNFPTRLTWREILNNPSSFVLDPFGSTVGYISAGSSSAASARFNTYGHIDIVARGHQGSTSGWSTSHPTPTITNVATRRHRARLSAIDQGSGPNLGVSFRMNPYLLVRGSDYNGFLLLFYGISTPTTGSIPHFYCGANELSLMTGNPDVLLNMFGFGINDVDINWQFMHNGSSGVATKIDLGSDFLISTSSVYDFALYAPPNSADIHWYARRLDAFYEISGTVTGSDSKLPLTSIILSAMLAISTPDSAAVYPAIDFQSIYYDYSRDFIY